MTLLNGIDVDELRSFARVVENDRSEASRRPVMVAHWEGGSRSRIEFRDTVTFIGGDGELNPMQSLLAALAACDVDLIAMHAALLGIPLESLTVEAGGHFNVASYLGIEDSPGSGYDRIDYRVRIRAEGVTEEQLAYFRRVCEVSSPVGDSLSRSVPLHVEVELE